MRYRIGEFARLGATSVKTLRFYAGTGLLEPAHVDARTGYRYYESRQLRDLRAIRALKELGASLADIRRVVSCRDGQLQRRRLLAGLRDRALRSLAATRRSLDWIEVELEDAEQSRGELPVILKAGQELRVASIRAQLSSYADITPVERHLRRALHPRHARDIYGVLWHRCEASGAIEGEPFIEVHDHAASGPGYELKRLSRVQLASAYCESTDDDAIRTYEVIDRWIHRHSLRVDGPKREIYVGQLLEIQFPVVPA